MEEKRISAKERGASRLPFSFALTRFYMYFNITKSPVHFVVCMLTLNAGKIKQNLHKTRKKYLQNKKIVI